MVRVGVGQGRVVDVEHTVVAVLVIVAPDVDHGVARVEVPVIADAPDVVNRLCTDSPAAPLTRRGFLYSIFWLLR